MLERPDIPDDVIVRTLRERWALAATGIAFLPLGADFAAAAFDVATGDGDRFFLKLRCTRPGEATLRVPHCLAEAGIADVVAPLCTIDGDFSASLGGWHAILYPFVAAEPAFERPLSPGQWREFATALAYIHATTLPDDVRRLIAVEPFSPTTRETVRRAMSERESAQPVDRAAADLLDVLATNADAILRLIENAGALAETMRTSERETVPSHGDLHAGNLLVGDDGRLHIVDWDEVRLAPRERDLMFVGAGIVGVWNRPDETEEFYRAYGRVPDPAALAYYRCERILQDVAETCDYVLDSTDGGDNRSLAVDQLAGQFAPGAVVDIAFATLRRHGLDAS